MAAIRTEALTHRYGRLTAVDGVDLEVPEGSVYALLGPNGAGKSTLLRALAGLTRPTSGRAWLLGREAARLTPAERASVVYVAEGLPLPGWMTLAQLERYLEPLYPRWDAALAESLRHRFRLDPRRRIRTLSRGEQMKAALLCSLAPRPRLLLMDEPFTGMDALIKDDLVRGLLEVTGNEGWTVMISSHDLGELESLADRVGFLDRGRLRFSETMDAVRERFLHVEVILGGTGAAVPGDLPPSYLDVEQSGPRVRFVRARNGAPAEIDDPGRWFPGAARIDVRPASLREIFVAMARDGLAGTATREESR